MNRKEILETAEKMVNGDRQDDYGTPENNFQVIADFWNTYLGFSTDKTRLDGKDVAAMLALLKIARIASGHGKSDNWIDLAGYAACGGEIQDETATRGGVIAVQDWAATLSNVLKDAGDSISAAM